MAEQMHEERYDIYFCLLPYKEIERQCKQKRILINDFQIGITDISKVLDMCETVVDGVIDTFVHENPSFFDYIFIDSQGMNIYNIWLNPEMFSRFAEKHSLEDKTALDKFVRLSNEGKIYMP